MSTPVLPRPSRSRVLIGLLLALLVQAGWLLLLQVGRPDHRPSKPQAVLTLRLIAPAVPPRPMAAQPASVASVAAIRQVGQVRQVPQAPQRRADEAPPTPVTLSTLPVTPPPALSPGPAALKLALPAERAASSLRSPTMLSQMLNDPRAQSVKRTVESALADAAGTLPTTLQASTDGTASKLIRQGSKCLRVSESRIKTLNPMDENSKGAPDVVGACF